MQTGLIIGGAIVAILVVAVVMYFTLMRGDGSGGNGGDGDGGNEQAKAGRRYKRAHYKQARSKARRSGVVPGPLMDALRPSSSQGALLDNVASPCTPATCPTYGGPTPCPQTNNMEPMQRPALPVGTTSRGNNLRSSPSVIPRVSPFMMERNLGAVPPTSTPLDGNHGDVNIVFDAAWRAYLDPAAPLGISGSNCRADGTTMAELEPLMCSPDQVQ